MLFDLNCDGLVNSFDISAMIKGLTGEFTNNIARVLADVDQSGTVDSADLKAIKQFVLGKITEFPIIEIEEELEE